MPSIRDMVKLGVNGIDIINYNSQKAQIVVPPVMEVAYAADSLADDITLLPAQDNKVYVIHGYRIMASNTAGTACTVVYVEFYDHKTGNVVRLDNCALTANQVNSNNIRMSGLNLPTFPGRNVVVKTDAVPAYREVLLYYSEILV